MQPFWHLFRAREILLSHSARKIVMIKRLASPTTHVVRQVHFYSWILGPSRIWYDFPPLFCYWAIKILITKELFDLFLNVVKVTHKGVEYWFPVYIIGMGYVYCIHSSFLSSLSSLFSLFSPLYLSISPSLPSLPIPKHTRMPTNPVTRGAYA